MQCVKVGNNDIAIARNVYLLSIQNHVHTAKFVNNALFTRKLTQTC